VGNHGCEGAEIDANPPEGGLDFKIEYDTAIDGYPGHEHAIRLIHYTPNVTRAIAEKQNGGYPNLVVD